MPVVRTDKRHYRAQLAPLGTRQRSQRPVSPSSSQANTYDDDHWSRQSSFDLSEAEPSQPPNAQVSATVEELLSQESLIANSMLLNEAVEHVEHDANVDTYSLQQRTSQPVKLTLVNIDDWDEHEAYDEQPPSCLHYSIEWKVTLNNKLISKDTEQDLVLELSSYWPLFLQPKLEKLLRKKLSANKRVRADDTNVVVSVTERAERDLIKRFDETEIDWAVIEKQLMTWGEFFRTGKKLRVDLSFNYLETGQLLSTTRKRGDKRGGSSATQQMSAEMRTQIDAEEESVGQPTIWRDVYNLMRCPGPPCHLGPHCWRDPAGRKHYKLKTHHLKSLIKYVEQGGQLRSHDDVPEETRQQLYAEEQQRLERHQRAPHVPASSLPPINITNVLPGSTAQSHMSTTSIAHPHTDTPTTMSAPRVPLVVPGLRDTAVREYSNWQETQVDDESLKADYRKAGEMALKDGFDLEQIYKDQNPKFFTERGVKMGVARRFVDDIEKWVKQYKRLV